MNLFYSYIRMFVFLGFTLVGIQVPIFVHQYGNILQAHLNESNISLTQFQDVADNYFGGSMDELVGHYKANNDQVFNAGGRSIEGIYERNIMLKSRLDDFNRGYWSRYIQVVFSPVSDVRSEVWKNFTYAVQLKPDVVLTGLFVGLIFTLLIEGLVRMLFNLKKLFRVRTQSI